MELNWCDMTRQAKVLNMLMFQNRQKIRLLGIPAVRVSRPV